MFQAPDVKVQDVELTQWLKLTCRVVVTIKIGIPFAEVRNYDFSL